MTTRTFTVPDHLERPVRDLIGCLQALTDDQLAEYAGMQRQRCDTTAGKLVSGQMVWDDNPIQGVEWALHDLRVGEHNYRQEVYQRTEAALAGGHLVTVGPGNDLDKFGAVCDPNPPGEFCWEGPDRDTLDEAIEDGRTHHPGHNPRGVG